MGRVMLEFAKALAAKVAEDDALGAAAELAFRFAALSFALTRAVVQLLRFGALLDFLYSQWAHFLKR